MKRFKNRVVEITPTVYKTIVYGEKNLVNIAYMDKKKIETLHLKILKNEAGVFTGTVIDKNAPEKKFNARIFERNYSCYMNITIFVDSSIKILFEKYTSLIRKSVKQLTQSMYCTIMGKQLTLLPSKN